MICVLLCIAVSFVHAKEENVVAAYVPEYRFWLEWDVVMSRLTHAILFSLEVASNGNLASLDRFGDEVLNKARSACNTYGTKLLFSIGGAGRSANYARVAASKATRERFARAVGDYVVAKQFDGVDIDWEGRDKGAATTANFVELLKEVRSELAKRSEIAERTADDRRYVLTLAAHVYETNVVDAAKWVDWVHLMTYDSCSTLPCRHATIEMTFQSVNVFAKAGVYC
jgi:chitinase